jgi:hypothetical protein
MPEEQRPAFPALAPAAPPGTAEATGQAQVNVAPPLLSGVEADATKVESYFLAHPLIMFGTGALIGACVALVIVHTLF